ncbi:GGDEF domain-containing protein [Campylobacter sp. MOP7]|uniref:GGDEF domain-containing protein n=1 Tax=Campylobacter canis TaxID=3378588 RepID=UPI00387E509B
MSNAVTKKYNILKIREEVNETGRDEVYRFLLLLFISINIIFSVFLLRQDVFVEVVNVYLFTSIMASYLYYKEKSVKEVVVYWVHATVVFHAVFGVLVYGWGFGMENLLIWSIGANYFIVSKRKLFPIVIIMFEAIVYVLFFIFKDHLGFGILDYKYKESCYLIIFLCIFASFVKRSMTLGSMHIKNFNDIQEQSSKVKEMSEHDYLTGLKNRMGVEHAIENMLKTCSNKKVTEAKKDFLIAIADIDNFKKINDTFGHGFGDEVIKSVAEVLSDNFRSNQDVVSRWGGEEFLIAVFVDDQTDAEKILNRILRKINMVKTPDDGGVGITFGAVVVECGSCNEIDIKNIVKLADELLYQGKTDGKNRVKITKWNKK